MKPSPLCVAFHKLQKSFPKSGQQRFPKGAMLECTSVAHSYFLVGSVRQICLIFLGSVQWLSHITVYLSCHEKVASERKKTKEYPSSPPAVYEMSTRLWGGQ